jgi:hypothetical protein
LRAPYRCRGWGGWQFRQLLGKVVTVPQLSDLRRQLGLPAYRLHPAILIKEMLACGELPAGPSCLVCGVSSDEVFHLAAVCERSRMTQPSSDTLPALAAAACQVLCVPEVAVDPGPEPEEKGDNLTVQVPVRVCRACRAQFKRGLLLPILRFAAIGAALAGWALMFA